MQLEVPRSNLKYHGVSFDNIEGEEEEEQEEERGRRRN